tara:strand:+ start:145 stop:375 length:231 start_codon:yes stop_codon:yes gene_type:complete
MTKIRNWKRWEYVDHPYWSNRRTNQSLSIGWISRTNRKPRIVSVNTPFGSKPVVEKVFPNYQSAKNFALKYMRENP